MTTMLIIIHVLVCVFLTLVVLLQQGAKQGMGAAFGGSSSTVFGGRGANTFLAKLTAGAAGLFMVTSLLLSYLSSPRGVMGDEPGVPSAANVDQGKKDDAQPSAQVAKDDVKKDDSAAPPAMDNKAEAPKPATDAPKPADAPK